MMANMRAILSRVCCFLCFIFSCFGKPTSNSDSNTDDSNSHDNIWDIIDFGADPTGASSSHSAMQMAIAAAEAAGGGTVFIPPGLFTITAMSVDDPITHIGDDLAASAIVLKHGINLKGSGQTSSILQFDAQYSYPWGHFAGLVVEGSQVVENFGIDGRREDQHFSSGCAIFYGITGTPEIADITFRNLRIANIPGVADVAQNCESFGIRFAPGARNISCDGIKILRVGGTGMNISSDEPLPDIESKGGGNFRVENCDLSDNDWQGLSVYGARDVIIKNVTATDNKQVGLNFEWATQTRVESSTATGNGLFNWRVMGKSDVTFFNCGAENAGAHEIVISEGGYWRSVIETSTAGMVIEKVLSAVPDRVLITGGKISKITDNLHYDLVLRGLDQPSHGQGHSQVHINVNEAWRWSLAGHLAIDAREYWSRLPPGLSYSGLPTTNTVPLRPFSDWVPDHGISFSSPYLGPDAQSGTGWTLRSALRGASFLSYPELQPGSIYRIKVRARQWQPLNSGERADGWSFVVQDTASPEPHNIGSIVYAGRADAGDWHLAESIVSIPNTMPHRVLVWYDRSATAHGEGRLDIDSLVVEAFNP